MKNTYHTPTLTIHGDVAKITLGGSGGISDDIIGNNNNSSNTDNDGIGCINHAGGGLIDFSLCSSFTGSGN